MTFLVPGPVTFVEILDLTRLLFHFLNTILYGDSACELVQESYSLMRRKFWFSQIP